MASWPSGVIHSSRKQNRDVNSSHFHCVNGNSRTFTCWRPIGTPENRKGEQS